MVAQVLVFNPKSKKNTTPVNKKKQQNPEPAEIFLVLAGVNTRFFSTPNRGISRPHAMVGRFESAELKRDALAHEARSIPKMLEDLFSQGRNCPKHVSVVMI